MSSVDPLKRVAHAENELKETKKVLTQKEDLINSLKKRLQSVQSSLTQQHASAMGVCISRELSYLLCCVCAYVFGWVFVCLCLSAVTATIKRSVC